MSRVDPRGVNLLERWNEQLRKHPRYAGAFLFLTTFVAFQSTLNGEFVFDDVPQILQNPFVTNPGLWQKIFVGSVWSFRGAAEHDNFYRPLQFLAYWLLYRLGGPDPTVFHLFQLLFYAGTVWLVFRVGGALLENHLAAFAGALLWAFHPQHVETVAWVSALPDAGAAFFCLLGFLLFLRAEKAEQRRPARHLLAALAYFPALFFKEVALSFPLLLLVYWFMRPGQDRWRRRALYGLPYGAAIAGYLAIRIAILGRIIQTPDFWKASRQVVEAAVGLLGQHARLFFWPAPLSAFRAFHLEASLRSPWPWLTLLALLAALGLRKREPIMGFLVLWWAVTLLPCLDVRQVGFPIADRFSYLPSVGLCLALAYLGLVWLPRKFPLRRPARIAVPVLGVVLIFWTTQALRAIPHWHDNVALWTYSYRVSPDAALVHVFQGALLQFEGRSLDEQAREYETALRLNQASLRPLVGLTYECYVDLGDIALSQSRIPEAKRYYQQAIQVAPNHSPAYKALGKVYFPFGDYAPAAKYFAEAVKLNPQDLEARFYLGTCLLKLGKPREAAAQFHAARVVDPTYTQAYEGEARALEAAGDSSAAAKVRGLMPKP
jgi:tetratricopeptide (TPR) repeat protein